MTSTGPIIEELPDDYDVAAEATSTSAASASAAAANAAATSVGGATGSTASVRSSESSSATPSSGLRRGFFTRQPARSPEPSPVSVPVQVGAGESPAPSTEIKPPAATAASQRPKDERAVALSEPDAEETEALASPADLVGGLRERLQTAVDKLMAARQGADEASQGAREVKELLSTIGSSVRWPTSQARSGHARAALEADSALAEMRSASNDARRQRSGDEKRALSDLRRASEQVSERVKKLVEVSMSKDMSEEDKVNATVEAFHALPLTAKLRVLADEGVALVLIAVSFVGGILIVLGILTEVYTACGCGFRCGQ
mmetsp:Transcript_94061/g.166609  ORF Transcript_94061/g.166609 Transcript_94061/m.166609 type:complete len:317 (-) Transcript_94061:112-1062(-)